MAPYRLLTTWLIAAPVEPVWEAICEPEAWPQWWRGVEGVEVLDRGDRDHVGSVVRHRWRGFLPYTVAFTTRTDRVEAPWLIEGTASGQLAGAGRWRLAEHPDAVTTVTYEWTVRTTEWWMNVAGALARPLLRANHDWVMARGGEGLAQRAGGRLIARR